ncbi:hypothetical protein PCASD_03064 [Puccinia coronata f. sp. avenae]|uniref:Uncharacterized protein n=1 Tax=Puccinia coronata f. sp. avenae TaxID=200324 RepID=A0A2N5V5T8_9BASI|nr:hypothetical protein PCASD_03064 [Puccinia coronata f. sp. avenae]
MPPNFPSSLPLPNKKKDRVKHPNISTPSINYTSYISDLPKPTHTIEELMAIRDRHDHSHPSYAYHDAFSNQSTSLPNNSSSSSIPTIQPPPNFLPMPFPPNQNPPYQY